MIAGALLVLSALNLRLIFPSLSIVLPEVIRDYGLSSAMAGYLTTLPVVCLGVFSLLAPACAARFGIERTLFGLLLVLAVGTALRGYAGVAGLFIGSAIAGACIAVGNVLLPALVKRDFAQHVAIVTAFYTVAMNVGASIAAATTLPLAAAFGGSWSTGLAIWAVPPALAALLWLGRLRRPAGEVQGVRRSARGLWADGLAWQVTLFMGLQSALAYCAIGWLAPIVRARGLDATAAGLVASLAILTGMIGSLVVPPLLRRFRNQQALNVIFGLFAGGALLGLLFAPLPLVWLFAVLQGAGQGGMFALALVVIVLRSPDTQIAAQLSSMAQAVGYTIAAGGPLLVGMLHGWTGGFEASGWLFAAVTVAACLCGWGAGRIRYVQAGMANAQGARAG